MAITITNSSFGAQSGAASADAASTAFAQHNQELSWLAEFLTGDEMMAWACVVDAQAPAETRNTSGEEWFCSWRREAIIRSALDMQRVRIAQLASVYDRRCCVHCEHALAPEHTELLASKLEAVQFHLDVLCRFALILRGVEQRLTAEASEILGISEHAVEGAYCAALESLEIMYSAFLLESYVGSSEIN